MRSDWIEYFMKIARTVAERATCDRLHVGAVLVKNRRIISTGYNGSLPGGTHCDEDGHYMLDGHCIRTVHAEMNALLYAARYGVPTEGATMFITHFPCLECFKGMVSAGVSKIRYDEGYRMDLRQDVRDFIEDIGAQFIPQHKAIYLCSKDISKV